MTQNDKAPTPQQEEILALLSAAAGRVLVKLKEGRGSFGLFEGGHRIGEYLFHASIVLNASDKGLLSGSPVQGYSLSSRGRRHLEEVAPPNGGSG